MRNYFYKIALLIQFFHDRLSCLVAVHACIFSAVFIYSGVIIHNIDLRQVMTFAHFEVVRVMCRRNLHRSCTELFVYIVIRHDRDFTSYKRQDNILAYDIFIAFIIRMHSDSSISQHGLGACRRNLKETVCPHDRILNMPEMSFLLLMLYLCVRKGSLTFRTPVDDP